MQHLNSSPDFKYKEHDNSFLNESVFTDEFRISPPKISDPAVLQGELPRRLNVGDALYSGKKYSILSPVTGVASRTPDSDGVSLRIDGGIRKKEVFENRFLSVNEVSSRILSSGLFSLDFPEIPLLELFQRFSGEKNSQIIFSPFTKDNFIDFALLVSANYTEVFALLQKNLKEIYPDSEIKEHISGNRIRFEYPLGNPSFFLSKTDSAFDTGKFPHESVLYFGPETLFHLLRVLYFSAPFISRHIPILTVDSGGRVSRGVRNFILRNGQSLSFLRSFYAKKYPYFTFNSMYDKNGFSNSLSPFYIDIYRQYSIIFFSEKPATGRELACIDCGDCSLYCPVSANPRALLDGNADQFDSLRCIECGLCTFYCPSRIDFRERIQKIKYPVASNGE